MRKLVILFFNFLLSSSLVFSQQLNVLFIGNSYTHYNNMPKMFEELAKSKGKNVFADSIAVSGSTLKEHAERESTYKKIKKRKWDIVIIQGFSRELAQDSLTVATETIPYVKIIMDSIQLNNPCSDFYFYMTWGYLNGIPTIDEFSTNQKMQDRIERGYFQMSNSFHVPIAPVGLVWQKVREQHPEFLVYQEDQQHPTPTGSFITASTMYASIFKESPVGGLTTKFVPTEAINPIEQIAAQFVLNNLPRFNLDTIQHPLPEVTPFIEFDINETWTNVSITNTSKHYNSISWDFGDGATSTGYNPKHYYKKSGTYVITLLLTKDCHQFFLKKRITVSKKDKYATSNPNTTTKGKSNKNNKTN